MQRRVVPVVGVALLLVLAGCSAGSPTTGTKSTPETGAEGTIRVSGAGSATADPDQAIVRVAVTATAREAVAVRRQLADNASRLRAALEELGLAESQITTTHYDLDRDLRRPEREGEKPRVRYRGSHRFAITLNRTDRVGAVIDTAVRNGATDVDDVRFTLSTPRRRQLERSARRSAMIDARQQARQYAAAANITITGVKVISTGSRQAPRPVARTATATPAPTASAGADTDVEGGPVTVVVTVRVSYRTAPASAGARADSGA